MAIADWTVSRATLIIFAVLFIILAFNVLLFYITKKKQKQKATETSEFKKALKDLEKERVKQIALIKSGKDVKEDTKITSFRISKSKSKKTFAYWKDWYLEKYQADKIILINMELETGFHRTFIVKENDSGFIFKKKKYLFDDEHKYYNIDAKYYCFDYHEGLTLPVRRKIPLTEIKKTIESTDEIDVEYAINPSTLQRFMTAKIAEGVMKGVQIDEFLRKLQTFIVVIMVVSIVHLALFLYASGILKNLKVPSVLG